LGFERSGVGYVQRCELAFSAGGCPAKAGSYPAGSAEPGHVVEGVELEGDLTAGLGLFSQFHG
jgi:hypothetical protein